MGTSRLAVDLLPSGLLVGTPTLLVAVDLLLFWNFHLIFFLLKKSTQLLLNFEVYIQKIENRLT